MGSTRNVKPGIVWPDSTKARYMNLVELLYVRQAGRIADEIAKDTLVCRTHTLTGMYLAVHQAVAIKTKDRMKFRELLDGLERGTFTFGADANTIQQLFRNDENVQIWLGRILPGETPEKSPLTRLMVDWLAKALEEAALNDPKDERPVLPGDDS